jgi:pteridine reductase
LESSADTLRGRVALVTGAAHRLGAAIATELARRGCDLVIHYGRSREAAKATAEALRQEYGVAVWTAQADLAEPDEIRALFAHVGEETGGLDLLVNSAATFDSAPLADFDSERWDRVQAVNLRAPHLCIRHALPLFAARAGDAAVVNIADLSGVVPWRDFSAHGVAKAGLLHLTRCAALELAPAVRVNAVVPGAILPPPGESAESESWQQVGRRLPLGRPGEPRDVGEAVAFLAAARFVTGEVLFVDGGEHLYGSTKR